MKLRFLFEERRRNSVLSDVGRKVRKIYHRRNVCLVYSNGMRGGDSGGCFFNLLFLLVIAFKFWFDNERGVGVGVARDTDLLLRTSLINSFMLLYASGTYSPCLFYNTVSQNLLLVSFFIRFSNLILFLLVKIIL